MIHLFLLFKIENATFVENLATMTSIVRCFVFVTVYFRSPPTLTHIYLIARNFGYFGL